MFKSHVTCGFMVALFIAATPATLAAPGPAIVATTPTPSSGKGELVVVKVNGMVCDFCARAVNKVFERRPEVAKVSVDLDSQTLSVTLKAGASMPDATLTGLIKDAGYALVSIERHAMSAATP